MPPLRPHFVLFGDSITQQGYAPGGWVARLSEVFQRRVDILNRGYSGYNTRWARAILHDVFPPDNPAPQLVTVFFGANDAVDPDGPCPRQYVPLDEYCANLEAIVTHLRTVARAQHIVLITPPPLDEHARLEQLQATISTATKAERTFALTAAYGDACKRTAQRMGVPCFDTHAWFVAETHWRTLLSDGLHLNAHGNERFFLGLMETLQVNVLENKGAEAYPHDLPWHADVDTDAVAECITRHRESTRGSL